MSLLYDNFETFMVFWFNIYPNLYNIFYMLYIIFQTVHVTTALPGSIVLQYKAMYTCVPVPVSVCTVYLQPCGIIDTGQLQP